MKTYILRDPKAVEPQNRKPNPRPNPLRHDLALTATGDVICGTPASVPPAPGGRVLCLGLDVHNDSIAVSLAPSDSTEVRRYGIIGGAHDDVLKLLKQLQAARPGVALKFCYEAGPRGYLGLCPGEHTSGAERKQGGITKLGNGMARKAMIEAAWHYRTPARISRTVLARQAGLPKTVTEAAWHAQTRLHQRYKHLTGVGRKKSQVAAAALGRELSGFVWVMGRRVKPSAVQSEVVKPNAV